MDFANILSPLSAKIREHFQGLLKKRFSGIRFFNKLCTADGLIWVVSVSTVGVTLLGENA
jgi:hypothetical protein